jgi:short-subunit dehydrogenase
VRRILVTGASSGIGAATVRAMAAPGTAIVVHARRSAEAAERVAAEARALGAEAQVLLHDLAKAGGAAALVARLSSGWAGSTCW